MVSAAKLIGSESLGGDILTNNAIQLRHIDPEFITFGRKTVSNNDGWAPDGGRELFAVKNVEKLKEDSIVLISVDYPGGANPTLCFVYGNYAFPVGTPMTLYINCKDEAPQSTAVLKTKIVLREFYRTPIIIRLYDRWYYSKSRILR